MVVLKPTSTVLEAARAIENNNIGAVLVQDERRVVGLVTERDLANRALGQALDPRTTLQRGPRSRRRRSCCALARS
jgi:CBS domain-containing protein